jgi:hypothetical protein
MELILLAAALLVYWAVRSLVLLAWRTRAVSKRPPT